MLNKKEQRLRRTRQTRIRIKMQGVPRLSVNRTNLHMYAALISACGGKVWLRPPPTRPTCARNWVLWARVATCLLRL